MLRWAIQHRAIVIPKSTHKERIRANGQVFDFALSDEDMQTLDELDRTAHSSRARG
jgi:diketogulonate reductase-like aldo/keto reductase